MIHLKSIARDEKGWPKRLGVLCAPDLTGQVHNDTEMYAAIRECGDCIVVPFKQDNPLEVDRSEILTAEEFCKTWRGD